MSPVFGYSEIELLAFSMVLLRVSAFMVTWPVFGTASMPNLIKILISIALAAVIYPTVSWSGVESDLLSDKLILIAGKEVMIGAFIGFLCRLFFFTINIAGQIVSTTMGLANAQLLNPTLGSTGSAVEQFQVSIDPRAHQHQHGYNQHTRFT